MITKEKYTLADTVDGMISADYKERFVAEYIQLVIRAEKLQNYIYRISLSDEYDSVDEPKHDCSISILREQLNAMFDYATVLEKRAIIEGIELP